MAPSPRVSTDLLVTGLDLRTGGEVHVDDAPVYHWYRKSVRGDRSLICLLCYLGDEAPPETVVPLVVKGRAGGRVRPHFAHPPGAAPANGHSPESLWHLAAKHQLAAWAATQPDVTSAVAERWTANRERRADVHVTFDGDAAVALEVQRSPLSDGAWLERHHSYQDQGINDVWIYPPRAAAHQVLFTVGLPLWRYDSQRSELGIGIAAAHPKPPGWENQPDLAVYADHMPPCVGDATTTRWAQLDRMVLTAAGIAVPAQVAEHLRRERDEAERRARVIRSGKPSKTQQGAGANSPGAAGDCRHIPADVSPPSTPTVMKPPGARPSTGEGESGWGERAWICPTCGNRSGLHPCRICHYEQFRGC